MGTPFRYLEEDNDHNENRANTKEEGNHETVCMVGFVDRSGPALAFSEEKLVICIRFSGSTPSRPAYNRHGVRLIKTFKIQILANGFLSNDLAVLRQLIAFDPLRKTHAF